VMAQLGRNVVLAFTHGGADCASLMPTESLVYFNDQEELLGKIIDFQQDDDKRRHWAGNARDFFRREINSTLYAQYIVETAVEKSYSHDYVWLQ